MINYLFNYIIKQSSTSWLKTQNGQLVILISQGPLTEQRIQDETKQEWTNYKRT